MQSQVITPLSLEEVSKVVERIDGDSPIHHDNCNKYGATVNDVAEGIGTSPEVVAQHLEVVRLQNQLEQQFQVNSDLNLRVSALEKRSHLNGFFQFLQNPGGAMTAVFVIFSLGLVFAMLLFAVAHHH